MCRKSVCILHTAAAALAALMLKFSVESHNFHSWAHPRPYLSARDIHCIAECAITRISGTQRNEMSENMVRTGRNRTLPVLPLFWYVLRGNKTMISYIIIIIIIIVELMILRKNMSYIQCKLYFLLMQCILGNFPTKQRTRAGIYFSHVENIQWKVFTSDFTRKLED